MALCQFVLLAFAVASALPHVQSSTFSYPACRAANWTQLDGPLNNAVNKGGYGDFFVDGQPSLNLPIGVTKGAADLGCYTLPTSLDGDFSKIEPGVTPAADGFMYTKYFGKFSKVSSCCSACGTTPTCVYWRYLPTSLELPNGYCWQVQGNLTLSSSPAQQTPTQSPQGLGFTCSVMPSIVGGKCHAVRGKIINDPHLEGARGTPYDFTGELHKTYCVISDKSLHVNMLMGGYLDDRTVSAHAFQDGKAIRAWAKEVGIVYRAGGDEHKLQLVARTGKEAKRAQGFLAAIVMNNELVTLPKIGEEVTLPGGAILSFGRNEEKVYESEVDTYSLFIPLLANISISMRAANLLLRTGDNAQVHFNLNFPTITATSSIHGVLGQTYRIGAERDARATRFSTLARKLGRNFQADADEGKGFLDGSRDDYVSSSITATDCKYSAF